jgi:beta-galactosidase/beta-glucuronidase
MKQKLFLLIFCIPFFVSAQLSTRWSKLVTPKNALIEYPRPQMVRPQWTNLNGLWEYAITAKDAGVPGHFGGQILVPYPIESALSGVKKALLPSQNLWYTRRFEVKNKSDRRILLHFGAVDWKATVFVNRKKIGEHQGGYTAFSFDITDAVHEGSNEMVVQVYDPTDEGIGPHGKQVLNPQNIYYTPTSGIWQTVWLETVPTDYISDIKLTPDIDKNILNIVVDAPAGFQIEVNGSKGEPGKEINLSVPNAHLWSPADPYLYDLDIKLKKGDKTIDEVKSPDDRYGTTGTKYFLAFLPS